MCQIVSLLFLSFFIIQGAAAGKSVLHRQCNYRSSLKKITAKFAIYSIITVAVLILKNPLH